jgi:hypothetical protein
MAETFQHLRYVFNTDSHKRAERRSKAKREVPPPLSRKTLDLGKQWEVRRFGASTILTQKTTFKQFHYILGHKDINRLTQMCCSVGDLEMYFANYAQGDAGGEIYSSYRQVLNLIVKAMDNSLDPGSIARACDVASALLLSYNATDVWYQSVVDQQTKITKEKLWKILDVEHLCAIFQQLPLAEGVELSKVYKFLPVPDFDFLTLFEAQRDKHHSTRPCFPENDLGLSERDFILYQRHQLIITYYASHGVCPGHVIEGIQERNWHANYPNMKPNDVPYDQVGDIVFDTPFQYEAVTQSYNPYIKDKALSPNYLSRIMDEAELRELPPHVVNYLLHYLFTYPVPTPENVARGMSEEDYERGHHVAPKGESKKKDPPRNFYINTYAGRILLSEIDNNISAYIEKKPGAFVGLSRAEAFNKFRDLAGTEDEHHEFTYVYVSFDLAGWSPKQSPLLRQLQLQKWSMAFNRDYILQSDKQFTEAKAHFIHKGIHQEYPLAGNDLEGYFARLNTDLHVDVMGYAVKTLRRLGYIAPGAKLAVQIDDGLCVLRFPPGTTNEHIVRAIKVIEKVYAWLSLEISWDKTYVSKRLRVFLNELEYDQIRITPGIKAFLRIRREGGEGIRCFLREANKGGSFVVGAIECGCPPALAWMKYALEVGKCILDWGRRVPVKMSPEEATLWAFTPVSFGGIGCLSMLQYSSNCTDNATSAGVSILKSIATYDKESVLPINRIINQPIRVRNPLSTFRDPLKFRIEGPTFTDLLEITYAKAALRDKVINPVVREALDFSDSLANQLRSSILPSFKGTRGKAVQLAYESTALATLDAILMKFARSSTVISLVGSRKALGIYIRYKADYARVITHMAMIIRGA